MHAFKVAAALGAALVGVVAAGIENQPRWASDCTEASTVTVTATVVPDSCTFSNPATTAPASATPSSAAPIVPPVYLTTIPSGSVGVPPGETPHSSNTVPTGPAPSTSIPGPPTSESSATTATPSTSVPSITTAAYTTKSTGSVSLPGTSSKPPVPTQSTGAATPSMTFGPFMARLFLASAVINGAFAILA